MTWKPCYITHSPLAIWTRRAPWLCVSVTELKLVTKEFKVFLTHNVCFPIFLGHVIVLADSQLYYSQHQNAFFLLQAQDVLLINSKSTCPIFYVSI